MRTQFSLSADSPTFVGSIGFAAVSLTVVNYTASEVYVRIGDNLAAGPDSYHYLIPPATAQVLPINNAQALSIAMVPPVPGAQRTTVAARVDIVAVDAKEQPLSVSAASLYRRLAQIQNWVGVASGASADLILDTRQGRSLAVGGYAQAGGLHGDTIAMLTFSLGDTPAGPWHFVQAVRLEGSKRIPLQAVWPVPASYCKVSFSNQDTVPLDATLYYEVLSGEVSGIEHRFPYQAVTNWANLANGSLQVTTVNNFGSYHVHSLSVTLIGLPSIPWSVDVRAIPDSGSTGYLLCDGSNLVASLTGSNGSPVPVTHPYCASNRNGVAIFELPFDLVSLYMLPYFSLSFKCGAGSFGTVRTVVNGERLQ